MRRVRDQQHMEGQRREVCQVYSAACQSMCLFFYYISFFGNVKWVVPCEEQRH
jgi:hypothetical protein